MIVDLFKRVKYGDVVFPHLNVSTYHDFSKEDMSIIRSTYQTWSDSYSEYSPFGNHSLEYYTGNCYDKINQPLRLEIMPSCEIFSDAIKELTNIIYNAPRTPCKMIVYRAVGKRFIGLFLDTNKKHQWFMEKGFLSTTLDPKAIIRSEGFQDSKTFLKIYIPENTPSVYVDFIKTHYTLNMNKEEKEFIFLPNHSLQLIKYPYEIDGLTYFECLLH